MSLTVSDFHREYALIMSEKALSQFVVDMAQSLGWRCHRTWISLHSPAGYPDLCCVRWNRIIYAELKTERGKLTEAQEDWILDLDAAGVEVHVWRPSHWLSGEIERVLREGESQDG